MATKPNNDHMIHFESSEGDKITVPRMQRALRVKQIRAINKKYKNDQDEMSWALLREALSEDDLERVENLFMEDFEAFMGEWTGNTGEDPSLGE